MPNIGRVTFRKGNDGSVTYRDGRAGLVTRENTVTHVRKGGVMVTFEHSDEHLQVVNAFNEHLGASNHGSVSIPPK